MTPCPVLETDGRSRFSGICPSCGCRELYSCYRRAWLGRYELAKVHKRIWIRQTLDGELIYTPPDFIRLGNRHDLDDLLEEINLGRSLIDAIMAFERSARFAPGTPGRAKQDRARAPLPSP